MIKLLITAVLIYLAYKTFVAPMLQLNNDSHPPEDPSINDDEYLDYEEVD